MRNDEGHYVIKPHSSSQSVLQSQNTEEKSISYAKKISGSIGICLETVILIVLGQIVGGIIVETVTSLMSGFYPDLRESGVWYTGAMYAVFIGIWMIVLLYIALIKGYRPIIKSISTKLNGNSWKMLLLGLIVGFLMNGACILAAWLHKDIILQFDCFKPLSFVVIFLTVFIQSSAEEFMCRGYLYQKLMKISGKPAAAIVGNSLLFAVLHLGNNGVTVLSVINIFLFGVFFSLIVYYMDSLWCAFAVHTAWNFTQNILFGLPNSGMIAPYSVFKLNADSAVNSFAYNVGFGIEGTVVADIVLLLACVALYLWGRKYGKKPYDIWGQEV